MIENVPRIFFTKIRPNQASDFDNAPKMTQSSLVVRYSKSCKIPTNCLRDLNYYDYQLRARSYSLRSEGPYHTLLASLGRALSYPIRFARKGPIIPYSLCSEGPYPPLRNASYRRTFALLLLLAALRANARGRSQKLNLCYASREVSEGAYLTPLASLRRGLSYPTKCFIQAHGKIIIITSCTAG